MTDGIRMKNAMPPMDWLTRLAHDLRSPITPMRFAVQLLQSDRLPPGRGPELLKTLDRQIDLLMQVADELSVMLQISNGQYALQMHRYELGAIVQAAVTRAARQANKAGKQGAPVPIRSAHEPILVSADEMRLAQLIAQLLAMLDMDIADSDRGWIEVERHADRALIGLRDGEHRIRRNAGIDYLITGEPPTERGTLGMGVLICREIAQRHDALVGLTHAVGDRFGGLQLSLPLAAP